MVVLPTYLEADNIESLVRGLIALSRPADFLIIDDNSPDGTGQIIDALAKEFPSVRTIHQPAKGGVGKAHSVGIRYGYERCYRQLLTMDADFSHQPEDVPRLLACADVADIVVTTRFKRSDSLREWNLLRKAMTHLGHALTRICLGLTEDATGAFRLYNLERIDRGVFDAITATDYEFFFESLYLLKSKGHTVCEVPIDLPKRVYGRSKMRLSHVLRGVARLIRLALRIRFGSGACRQ